MSTADYGEAVHAIARAGGDVQTTRSELLAFAEALDANSELRSTLANALVPASTRNQIVDDLIAGRVSDTTRAIVAMLVTAGQGGDIGQIVQEFVKSAATASGNRFAVVRSAVPLSAEQERRLAAALATRAGGPVEIHTEIDPSVVGGVVTSLGDTVIDGSVRSRMNKMREAL